MLFEGFYSLLDSLVAPLGGETDTTDLFRDVVPGKELIRTGATTLTSIVSLVYTKKIRCAKGEDVIQDTHQSKYTPGFFPTVTTYALYFGISIT